MRKTGIHGMLFGLCLVALSAGACSKHPRPDGPLREAAVDIHVSLDGGSEATKALADFSNGSNYGIFACVHENTPSSFAPFKSSVYNARAKKVSAKWLYDYVGTASPGALDATNASSFVLLQRADGKTADLYAYAPWIQEAYLPSAGPTKIPFKVSEQKDLMYAEQNLNNDNGDLDPASMAPLSATFHFKHAMARLVFRFRVLNVPTNYRITSVSIARTDGAATSHLYTSGTFNAITGALDCVEEVNADEKHILAVPKELTVDSTTPAALAVLLAPTEVADDELSFTFTVNGQKLQPFVLKKEFVEHGPGSGVYGFQAGYTYTFNFTLDNYVYFDGFSVNEDWESLDLPLPDYI